MPTQAEYSDAVYRAALVNVDEVSLLVTAEKYGKPNIDWSEALCHAFKVEVGVYCMSVEDYTSEASISLYNDLLSIAGAGYSDGITTDPNAQIPNVIIVNPGGGSYTPPDPLEISIPVGTVPPKVYIYVGDYTIQDYYLEMDMGGGVFTRDNSVTIQRTNNQFTLFLQGDPDTNLTLDAYRFTLVLA
jgi:hypothetical protein